MKKFLSILCLVLCFAMLFSLTACDQGKDDPNIDNGENNGENNGDNGSEKVEIKVGVLKGPTGIGAVKFMKDAQTGATDGKYSVTLYETASVGNLNNDIINGTLDIAALPINAGATLYNKSEGKIQVLAANALGVLSIVGKEELSDIKALEGETIHTTGQASTPEYILDFILEENGLTAGEDVEVIYYPDGNTALAAMLKDGGYAMLPEPATTSALAQNADLKIIFDVTSEWDKVSDTQLIQGCLVVNKAFADSHKEEVEEFLREYAEGVKYVQENTSAAAELVVEFGIIANKTMAENSIPRSNVVCITGSDMKSAVSAMLGVLYDANASSVGGALPDDAYYYVGG